jgi:hypothetical protein
MNIKLDELITKDLYDYVKLTLEINPNSYDEDTLTFIQHEVISATYLRIMELK